MAEKNPKCRCQNRDCHRMHSNAIVQLAGVLILGALLQAEAKTVKVLAVGNSFSADALTYLGSIAQASGHTLVAANAMIGGCDFERHLRHADAHEADPAATEGRPYANQKSLRDLLAQEQWDVVTIQQASPKSFKPETFQPHADRLIEYIRRYAPQAEVVIHQTWAYRDDHPFWGLQELNPDVMYKGLRAAYDGLAQAKGLRQIPCGDALEWARRDPAWGRFVPDPGFDPKAAVYPQLPQNEKRALHVGYTWRKDPKTGAHTLGKDAIHANARGDYLLGCVWFEFLFGESVLGNPFAPKGVEAADLAVLQRVAHAVVSDRQRPQPIP